jgi:hypothetical protein
VIEVKAIAREAARLDAADRNVVMARIANAITPTPIM